jgi:uncharacterized protein (DUF885 family)
MKPARLLWMAIGLVAGGLTMSANESHAGDARLDKIFRDYWEVQMQDYPTWATYLGDYRYDDRLTDHSAEAYAHRTQQARSFLRRIDGVPLDGLSSADSLNHMLFRRQMADALEGAEYDDYLMPITQQGGPPNAFAELPSFHPMRNVRDVETYIARLRAFPDLVDQVMANMAEGMKRGLMPARITMAEVLPQYEAMLTRRPADCVLAEVLDRLPEDLTPAEAEDLRFQVLRAIRDQVIPSYRKLRNYIRDRYIRACRKDDGIWSLPAGRSRYAYLVRYYTTTEMSPQEIHETGQRELGEIKAEMRQITNGLGYRGTLADFSESLRSNPRYYYTTPEKLMQGFRTICKRMDERLDSLFGRLPNQWYDLKEMEAFRAPAAPAAYYYGAPDDGSRPGYFYVNTYKPETRPKYTMEALAYHEAVPGHHLQLTIQQELQGLPDFRRHGGFTAFVEGWGLYAELLPKEVGLYADLYSDFGRLTYQAWRAVRLIVDTGIHEFKWTREDAIEFFKENTALSEVNIISEVDRYIATPGQALAYMIGRLKIQDLRSEAELKLGDRFDIRAFHDALLEEGALPLDLLDIKMNRWLATQEIPMQRPQTKVPRRR